MVPPASLTWDDVAHLPELKCQDASNSTWPRFNNKTKLLIIPGAMKAGTTALYFLLLKHQGFMNATTVYRSGWRANKETRFFSEPALPAGAAYANMFEPRLTHDPDGVREAIGDFVVMDATADYFDIPWVAPRLKKVAPHARIVLLIRDPVARLFSQWRMIRQQRCGVDAGSESCTSFRLEDTLEEFMQLSPECRFTVPGANVTQLDCFSCTTIRIGTAIDAGAMSNYGAILGWWLSFFPPNQILLIDSNDMKYPGPRLRAVNAIVAHVGLRTTRFTAAEVAQAPGFNGLGVPLTTSERHGLQRVRAEYGTPMRDFHVLQRAFWPDKEPISFFEPV